VQDVYRRTGKVVPDGRRGIVDRAAYMSFLESQLERVTVCVLCQMCVLLVLALQSAQQCCDRESAGLNIALALQSAQQCCDRESAGLDMRRRARYGCSVS